MTKHEAAWLALRVSGLVLALSAIEHLSAIAYFAWLLFAGVFQDVQGSISDRLSLQSSLPQFIYGAVVLAAAYYLLFRGEALHRFIMKEGKNEEPIQPPEPMPLKRHGSS
jgi:uncharacterized membrane protein YwaF